MIFHETLLLLVDDLLSKKNIILCQQSQNMRVIFMQMSAPVRYTDVIKPICIVPQGTRTDADAAPTFADSICTVVGWGITCKSLVCFNCFAGHHNFGYFVNSYSCGKCCISKNYRKPLLKFFDCRTAFFAVFLFF